MKLVIRVWNISVILLLVTLIVSSLIQKSILQSELKSVVSDSLVQVARVMVDKRYPIETDEELMAEFEQHLFENIRVIKGTTLNVYYLTASIEQGVLSVEITQESPFLFFPSKSIIAHSHQSILLENEEKTLEWYEIRYHSLALSELPKNAPHVHIYGKETKLLNPNREGKRFLFFKDNKGNIVEKIEATTNHTMDLYAIWE